MQIFTATKDGEQEYFFASLLQREATFIVLEEVVTRHRRSDTGDMDRSQLSGSPSDGVLLEGDVVGEPGGSDGDVDRAKIDSIMEALANEDQEVENIRNSKTIAAAAGAIRLAPKEGQTGVDSLSVSSGRLSWADQLLEPKEEDLLPRSNGTNGSAASGGDQAPTPTRRTPVRPPNARQREQEIRKQMEFQLKEEQGAKKAKVSTRKVGKKMSAKKEKQEREVDRTPSWRLSSEDIDTDATRAAATEQAEGILFVLAGHREARSFPHIVTYFVEAKNAKDDEGEQNGARNKVKSIDFGKS